MYSWTVVLRSSSLESLSFGQSLIVEHSSYLANVYGWARWYLVMVAHGASKDYNLVYHYLETQHLYDHSPSKASIHAPYF